MINQGFLMRVNRFTHLQQFRQNRMSSLFYGVAESESGKSGGKIPRQGGTHATQSKVKVNGKAHSFCN